MNGAFSYPARSYDRALAAAGTLERLARAALRHLRSGGLGAARSALSWRREATPTGETATAETATGAEAVHPPILYLPAVSWSYRFQRPQHLARALARAGHPVLYVDGFLRSRLLPSRHLLLRQGGLHVLRMRVPGRPDPYREPLERLTAVRMADTILAGLRYDKSFMVLVQLPFWAELGRELARRLQAPLVYDRIDLHAGFPGVPAHRIEAAEAQLIRESDLVCTTSDRLAELPQEMSAPVLRLPNGVDLAAVPAAEQEKIAGGLQVGYVGALGPWFDVEAVAAAARALPDWRFRLAGRVEDPDVAALAAQLPNLETVGEIPFAAVPPFLAGLAVALVPFRDLPLTRAVDPVKLYEALAMGLPVVARRLPETERWAEPLVYLYDTPADLVRQVQRAAEERTPELALRRRQAAAAESWDRRAAELLRAVAALASGSP